MCKICRMFMIWELDGLMPHFTRAMKWEHIVRKHLVVNDCD